MDDLKFFWLHQGLFSPHFIYANILMLEAYPFALFVSVLFSILKVTVTITS